MNSLCLKNLSAQDMQPKSPQHAVRHGHGPSLDDQQLPPSPTTPSKTSSRKRSSVTVDHACAVNTTAGNAPATLQTYAWPQQR